MLLRTCREEPEGSLEKSRGWEHSSPKAARGHAGQLISISRFYPALTRAGSCFLRLPQPAWARSQRGSGEKHGLAQTPLHVLLLVHLLMVGQHPRLQLSGQLYLVELLRAAPCILLSIHSCTHAPIHLLPSQAVEAGAASTEPVLIEPLFTALSCQV